MPAIHNIRLQDANVRVGPTFIKLDGYGDDKFTLAPFTDVGAFQTGIDGDTMHVQRAQNGWLFTGTFIQSSQAITTLLNLHQTLGVFQIAVTYGAFNLTGWMNMINLGDLAASLSTLTRTMTGGVSKVSGTTDVAPGQVLQIL
jgi:hypothetical protein